LGRRIRERRRKQNLGEKTKLKIDLLEVEGGIIISGRAGKVRDTRTRKKIRTFRGHLTLNGRQDKPGTGGDLVHSMRYLGVPYELSAALLECPEKWKNEQGLEGRNRVIACQYKDLQEGEKKKLGAVREH